MASELATLPGHSATNRPFPPAAIWVSAAGCALVLVYVLGLALSPAEAYLRFQADILYPLAPAGALVLAAMRWHRSSGTTRLGWLALTIGVAAWLLGDLQYTWYDLRHGEEPPFPGPADILYGVGYFAFALGLTILTMPALRVRDWRWLIDASLTLVVVGAISWVYLVDPLTSAGYSPFDATIAMAYPVADFALISLAIIGWYASAGQIGATRALIVSGLVAFAVADAGYTYLITTVGYDNVGNPLDPLWMAGYVLFALAAIVPSPALGTERAGASVMGVLTPYAIAAAVSALAFANIRTGDPHTAITAAAITAVALVVSRQILTLTENVRLYRSLEARTAELTTAHEALTTSDARLRTIVGNAPVVLIAFDHDGTVVLAEGAALASLGLSRDDLVGRTFTDIYAGHPAIVASISAALNGEEVNDTVDVGGMSFATRYVPLRDATDAVTGVIGVATDVSERERFQRQLAHVASHDPLTGLLNRRRLDEELSRTVAEFTRHAVPAALLFIDLDQFKDVNDGYGHRAGDELLAGVAELLRTGVRETDIVARLGGDEFAIILTHADRGLAMDIAAKLIHTVGEHEFVMEDAVVRVTASIGIAIVGADGTTSQDLLARADIAMYRAKDDGRNRARAYDPDADAEAHARSSWQLRIHDALAGDRLILHAQPIVALPERAVVMYEVLVRMVLPSGEVVGPSSFLGVAERSGSIVDIDCWVLTAAIRLIAESRATGADLHLSANVSGRSLADRDRLLSVIEGELTAHNVPGDHLVIEITETTAMHDLEGASEFARAVKALGCAIALDDFGVGFSSFSQLKRLPVDYLKIDGSFVVNLPRDRVDQQLVATMTAAAHALDKKVIAEFVTDEETVQILKSLGVDYVQGYHLGTPAALHHARLAA